jgi:hypothetical protein
MDSVGTLWSTYCTLEGPDNVYRLVDKNDRKSHLPDLVVRDIRHIELVERSHRYRNS